MSGDISSLTTIPSSREQYGINERLISGMTMDLWNAVEVRPKQTVQ
jgi:hypothetical protein